MGNYKRYYGNDNIETQMNAKELVLDKINASVDTLGMYIYAIAMGVDVKKFTRFMTMPIIDKLIKLSKSNVINPERKESSIQSAIKDIQNGYLDTSRYSKYIDYKHASSILQAIEPNLFKEYNISDFDASKLFKGLFNPLSLQDIKDKKKLESFNDILDSIKSKLEKGEIKTLKILKTIQSYSEDYDDFGGYDDDSGGGSTVDIAVSFNRWYQDSKNMIGSVSDDDVQLVNLFERIKNESNALKVLGQVLGINQKIKTEEYDFYKYNNVLSNFLNPLVNKKLEKFIQEYSTKKREEVVDYFSLKYQALYNDGQGFSFIDFISDQDYREQAIQEYGELTDRSQLNILEILSSSEHFMEMVSLTYYLSENVFKTSSAKYRTLNSIINGVEQDRIFGNNGSLPKSISKDVYLKLSNYVDDVIVNSFLSQNNGLKIKINGGDPYSYITENEIVKSKKRGSSEDVDLSTYEGRSKFTSWFENIIRNIQMNKQFRDKDGGLYKNESFNNAFINNIIPEYKRDMITEEDYGIMKPSISIGANMTMQDAALKQKMVEGLKQLKNVTYNGHNMLDLIFLYDLIVNRGKKNQQSFAGFIAEAYPLDDIRLIANQYTSYLKDIDASGISFDYNKNDFLLRGIAEKESTKPSPGGIYYQQYYNPSENKIKRNYIQDGNIYQVTLNSMSKNIPLNGVYKQKPRIDPSIIVSIDNSDVKITIKC